MGLRDLLDTNKYFLLLHQQNVANEASISIIKMHLECVGINILFCCQYRIKDVILNSQSDSNYKN